MRNEWNRGGYQYTHIKAAKLVRNESDVREHGFSGEQSSDSCPFWAKTTPCRRHAHNIPSPRLTPHRIASCIALASSRSTPPDYFNRPGTSSSTVSQSRQSFPKPPWRNCSHLDLFPAARPLLLTHHPSGPPIFSHGSSDPDRSPRQVSSRIDLVFSRLLRRPARPHTAHLLASLQRLLFLVPVRHSRGLITRTSSSPPPTLTSKPR